MLSHAAVQGPPRGSPRGGAGRGPCILTPALRAPHGGPGGHISLPHPALLVRHTSSLIDANNALHKPCCRVPAQGSLTEPDPPLASIPRRSFIAGFLVPVAWLVGATMGCCGSTCQYNKRRESPRSAANFDFSLACLQTRRQPARRRARFAPIRLLTPGASGVCLAPAGSGCSAAST